jgi:CheY-like chemotaxis protein
MSSNGSKRLLVVDDEPSICALVRRIAEAAGYEVAAAGTHEEFIRAYETLAPNVIAMDLVMPQVDGIALLEILAEKRCRARIIVMTGHHPELLKSAARIAAGHGLDIRDTLHKPFGESDLRRVLSVG